MRGYEVLQEIRKRYPRLRDKEVYQYLSFAKEAPHRIPAPYREAFKNAYSVLEAEQKQAQIESLEGFSTMGTYLPTPQYVRSVAEETHRRQFGEALAVAEANAPLWQRVGSWTFRKVGSLFDGLSPILMPFSVVGNMLGAGIRGMGSALAAPLNALEGYQSGYYPSFWAGLWEEAKGAGRSVVEDLSATGLGYSLHMLEHIQEGTWASPIYRGLAQLSGFNPDQLLATVRQLEERDVFPRVLTLSGLVSDPTHYFALGRMILTEPDAIKKVREGQPSNIFDSKLATIQFRDGTSKTVRLTDLEIEQLQKDPNVLTVDYKDEDTVLNTERLLGFNRYYLSAGLSTLFLDPLNFVGGFGKEIAEQGAVRGLGAMAKSFRQNPVMFPLRLMATAFELPVSLPIAGAGRVLGFSRRILPTAEEVAENPILRSSLYRRVEGMYNRFASMVLPYFYNVGEEGVAPSRLVRFLRPVLEKPKEERMALVEQGRTVATRLAEELPTGQVSDESWDFLRKVADDVPDLADPVERANWALGEGAGVVGDVMRFWRNPIVAETVVKFGDGSPAFSLWWAGVLAKDATERALMKRPLMRKAMYPIVRLFMPYNRLAEEAGRQVRQAQQAQLDTYRAYTYAFSRAISGSPEFEKTPLYKAIDEHLTAYAKLSDMGAGQEAVKQALRDIPRMADVGVLDDVSYGKLSEMVLDLLRSSAKREEVVRMSDEELVQYLRQSGINVGSAVDEQSVASSLRSLVSALEEMNPNVGDSVANALSDYFRTGGELRRYGLDTDMASDLQNLYMTMRVVGEKMGDDFRRQMENLTLRLATGQSFDPNELRAFMKRLDDEGVPEGVKQMVMDATASTANIGRMQEVVLGYRRRMAGVGALWKELSAAKGRIEIMNQITAKYGKEVSCV